MYPSFFPNKKYWGLSEKYDTGVDTGRDGHIQVNADMQSGLYQTGHHTGCPKSKVTILIFNNFLMKEVVWMKFSWYLAMFLNFFLKLINLCKFIYYANGNYSCKTGNFPDNVTIQELMTFSNKRMYFYFPVLIRIWKLLII